MKSIRKAISSLVLLCLAAFMLSLSAAAAAVPAAPEGLKAETVKQNRVVISWDKSRYADFYRVYIRKNGEWKELEDLTERSCEISGLKPATTYTFAVKSVNESGNRDYFSKEYATLKVKTKSLSKAKPTAVSGVDYVKLKWKKVSYATGYNVYRRVDGKWSLVKKLGKDARSYTVKDLKSDTSYQFSVRARRTADGKTVYGSHSSVKISTMKPNKVKLTVVSSTESSVKLKWTKAEDATGYRIYRYSGGEWKSVKTVRSQDKLSAVITSLKSDSKHKLRVRAFCEYDDRTVWFTPSASKTAVTDPTSKDLTVYRTDKLKDLFAESFTLSYKGENDSYGSTVVKISKSGEKYYLYSKVNYTEYELLNIKSGNYILLKQKEAYVKASDAMASALDISSAVEALLPSGRMKAKATLAEFEGESVVCETYKNTTGSRKINYFYKAGDLVGIEQYSAGKLVERAVITVFEKKALKGVFKIPSSYKELI